MRSETNTRHKNPNEDIPVEEAKLLWDEYKYRHELCWRLIFQITTAVVALLVIPYIQSNITELVGLWILALPLLAIILVAFSISRLKRELGILDKIRMTHRERQGRVYGITWKSEGHFTRDVILYLVALGLMSLADMIALIYIWLPV